MDASALTDVERGLLRQAAKPSPDQPPPKDPGAPSQLPPIANDGKGKHRLAVVVPFRDSASQTSQGANRTENLNEFVPYIHHVHGKDTELFA